VCREDGSDNSARVTKISWARKCANELIRKCVKVLTREGKIGITNQWTDSRTETGRVRVLLRQADGKKCRGIWVGQSV
jgi:hypothetical protein